MRLVLLWWMGFLASSWAPRAVVNEEGVGVGDVLLQVVHKMAKSNNFFRSFGGGYILGFG